MDTRELPSARSYPLQLLTALYWMAAAGNVLAGVGHFGHFWLFGLFFACLAAWQTAWGVLLYRDPTERALMRGAGANMGVAVLGLATFAVGLVVGPQNVKPGAVEFLCFGPSHTVASADGAAHVQSLGFLNVAPALDELAIAGLGLALVVPRLRRRLGAKPFEWLLVVLLIASGVALMAGGHHHHG